MDYFRMIENNRNRVIGYNKVNYNCMEREVNICGNSATNDSFVYYNGNWTCCI